MKKIGRRARNKARLCGCGSSGHYSSDDLGRIIWTCEGCGKEEFVSVDLDQGSPSRSHRHTGYAWTLECSPCFPAQSASRSWIVVEGRESHGGWHVAQEIRDDSYLV